MKKLLSIMITFILVFSMTAVLAEPTVIDGLASRKIKINEAGLNPSADEMIAQNISPTTGRNLVELAAEVPEEFSGMAATGYYQPIMVQISNAGGGANVNSKGQPLTAPINLQYADVVYEACQANSKTGGSLTRLTAVFSDIVPNYVGFVRSTRLTHCRLRQEWNSAFVTSGYSAADVPGEWKELINPNMEDKKNDYDSYMNPYSTSVGSETKPGLIYVQNYSSKFYTKYMFHMTGISDGNDHVYQLANILSGVYPKYYTFDKNSKEYKYYAPHNHTWKFTDEVPAGGDDAEVIYIQYGHEEKTDSRLEYDAASNTYYRYVWNGKQDVLYRVQQLYSPEIKKKNVNGSMLPMVFYQDRVFGDPITFSNVIVQGITMNWRGSERPDPELVGTGNADYFMGGKHYKGVWKRKDNDSRTVFYGEDGNEIELQRGKTLIILMDYNSKGRQVQYDTAAQQ